MPIGGPANQALAATLPISEANVTNLVADLAAKVDVAGDTMTGTLTVQPVTGTEGIVVTGVDGNSTKLIDVTALHTDFFVDSDGSAEFSSDDAMFVGIRGSNGTAGVLRIRDAANNEVRSDSTSGGGPKLALLLGGSVKLQLGVDNGGGSAIFPFLSAGAIAASQFSIHLDDTIGATKLVITAKDSGGTTRTASINLT